MCTQAVVTKTAHQKKNSKPPARRNRNQDPPPSDLPLHPAQQLSIELSRGVIVGAVAAGQVHPLGCGVEQLDLGGPRRHAPAWHSERAQGTDCLVPGRREPGATSQRQRAEDIWGGHVARPTGCSSQRVLPRRWCPEVGARWRQHYAGRGTAGAAGGVGQRWGQHCRGTRPGSPWVGGAPEQQHRRAGEGQAGQQPVHGLPAPCDNAIEDLCIRGEK